MGSRHRNQGVGPAKIDRKRIYVESDDLRRHGALRRGNVGDVMRKETAGSRGWIQNCDLIVYFGTLAPRLADAILHQPGRRIVLSEQMPERGRKNLLVDRREEVRAFSCSESLRTFGRRDLAAQVAPKGFEFRARPEAVDPIVEADGGADRTGPTEGEADKLREDNLAVGLCKKQTRPGWALYIARENGVGRVQVEELPAMLLPECKPWPGLARVGAMQAGKLVKDQLRDVTAQAYLSYQGGTSFTRNARWSQ